MYKFGLFVAIAVFAACSAQSTPSYHDCRICEFIISLARYHFKGNITDENALKTQLLTECSHISNQADQATCKAIVNNNIDKFTLYDLKDGDHSGTTCVDIGYCTSQEASERPTGFTRPTDFTRPAVKKNGKKEEDYAAFVKKFLKNLF